LNDPYLLDKFNVIAFVGGFSFADVLGSATGWYSVIKNNPTVKEQFDRYFARDDTYSLGVCNGCQLMVKMGLFGEGIEMNHNLSGRFESRFPTVCVEESKCKFTEELVGLKCGIWVAHGEGRFVMSQKKFDELEKNGQIVMRYTDFKGDFTMKYPHNPNGSIWGVAGICSENGRHFALMPHPERSFMRWQLPWSPIDMKGDYTPWFKMFRFGIGD